MPRQTAIDAANRFRRDLANQEAQSAERMATIYARIYGNLRKEAASLAEQIAGMDKPSRDDIIKLARTQELLKQVKEQVTRFGGTVQDELVVVINRATQQGVDNAIALMTASLPPGLPTELSRALSASFARLPAGAVEAAAGLMSEDSPLRQQLTEKFGEWTADQVERHLTDGIAAGMNPRRIAAQLERNLQEGLGSGLTSALSTIRTAQIKSYGIANNAVYNANSNIIRGWIWWAELAPSTCLSCIALHGTIHPLDEILADHHAGRCLTPGVMVNTKSGLKPIKQVGVGDYVLTHLGRYRRVIGTSTRFYDGQILKVNQKGYKVACTPEHPFLTNQGWVEAKELSAAFTLFTLNDVLVRVSSLSTVQPSPFSRSSFFLSIGRFLGELCQRESSSTANIWNGKAKSILKLSTAYWGKGLKWLNSKASKNSISPSLQKSIQLVCRLLAKDNALAFWLSGLCRVCLRKLGLSSIWRRTASLGEIGSTPHIFINFINDRVLIPSSFVISRYVAFSSMYRRFSQVSICSPILDSSLHNQVWDCIIPLSLGDLNKPSFLARCCTLLDVRPGSMVAIWWESIYQKLKRITSSSLSVHFERIVKSFLYGIIIHQPKIKIKSISYSGMVYNLQVHEDESYIANGIVVHNCAALPQTITYADLGLDIPEDTTPPESGESWFSRQPESVQREMMGPGKFEAWQKGQFEFSQLSKDYDDPAYGTLKREATLTELTGE